MSDLITFDTFDRLERRVEMLEGMLKTYFAEKPAKRIHAIEEQIKSIDDRLAVMERRLTDEEEIADVAESGNSGFEASEERKYVSSLSGMDELAKEEYYPFGRPLNKEDEY